MLIGTLNIHTYIHTYNTGTSSQARSSMIIGTLNMNMGHEDEFHTPRNNSHAHEVDALTRQTRNNLVIGQHDDDSLLTGTPRSVHRDADDSHSSTPGARQVRGTVVKTSPSTPRNNLYNLVSNMPAPGETGSPSRSTAHVSTMDAPGAPHASPTTVSSTPRSVMMHDDGRSRGSPMTSSAPGTPHMGTPSGGVYMGTPSGVPRSPLRADGNLHHQHHHHVSPMASSPGTPHMGMVSGIPRSPIREDMGLVSGVPRSPMRDDGKQHHHHVSPMREDMGMVSGIPRSPLRDEGLRTPPRDNKINNNISNSSKKESKEGGSAASPNGAADSPDAGKTLKLGETVKAVYSYV
jgi:hypothetical protein